MTVRPILFSGPMVRALLDGRKTQTRRVLKPQPTATDGGGVKWQMPGGASGYPESVFRVKIGRWHPLPYSPGDLLWVREAVRFDKEWDPSLPRVFERNLDGVRYESDGHYWPGEWGDPFNPGRLRHGMFMPRWASRLTLRVTDVRVQRAQEISEADAEAEGAEPVLVPPDGGGCPHVEGFRDLWDGLNAKRGFGWDANPWIVAVSFEVYRKNVEDMQP